MGKKWWNVIERDNRVVVGDDYFIHKGEGKKGLESKKERDTSGQQIESQERAKRKQMTVI